MFLLSFYELKAIENYLNFLAKDLKDQFIGMNIKQKLRTKITTNEYRYFLKSNFVGFNTLFVLVYSNQDVSYKRFKTNNRAR